MSEEDFVKMEENDSPFVLRTRSPAALPTKRRAKPSDAKDYHQRVSGLTDIRVRVPPTLAPDFNIVKQHLKGSNVDVLHWLCKASAKEIKDLPSLTSATPPLTPSTSSPLSLEHFPGSMTSTAPSSVNHSPLGDTPRIEGVAMATPSGGQSLTTESASLSESQEPMFSMCDLDEDPDVLAALGRWDYDDDRNDYVPPVAHDAPLSTQVNTSTGFGLAVPLHTPTHIQGTHDCGESGHPDSSFEGHSGHIPPLDPLDLDSDLDWDDFETFMDGDGGPVDYDNVSDGDGDGDGDDTHGGSPNPDDDPRPTPWSRRRHARKPATHAFLSLRNLHEFFSHWPVHCSFDGCHAPCSYEVDDISMCWSVKFTCSDGHRATWLTGEMKAHHCTPEVQSRLFCAALCAGLSYTQLCELCRTVGLREPHEKTFYRFQSGSRRNGPGWIEAALDVWDEQKKDLQAYFAAECEDRQVAAAAAIDTSDHAWEEHVRALEFAMDSRAELDRHEAHAPYLDIDETPPVEYMEILAELSSLADLADAAAAESLNDSSIALKKASELLQHAKGLLVMADARFDSSRSGYHGTAPIIEYQTGLVIEMTTHTRVEDGGSWNIEDTVVKEGLEKLIAAGVLIAECIHDDKNTIDAILASFDIVSQKDLWHKTKKLMQKFRDQLENVKKKVSPVIVATTTEEDLWLMTKKTMEAYLRVKGQPVSGNKGVLVARILALHGRVPTISSAPTGRGGAPTLAYPEFAANDMADKFKSWFYVCATAAAQRGDKRPGLFCMDLANCAKHWSGDHSGCRLLDPTRACVLQCWGQEHAYFAPKSASYKALKAWLKQHITRGKMAHYLRARENFMSETFHSLINKYATKRIHWKKSHYARLACTALDWNENRSREVLAVFRRRTTTDTTVRRRPATYRVLSAKTELWKDKICSRILDIQEP